MKAIMDAWIKDLAYAARSLSRAPGFTLVTVTTLALAIGATTAIFSVVDAVLLGGLPYPEARRLVAIRGSAPGSNLPEEIGVPDELYVQYREHATLLEDAGTYGLFQSTTRVDQQVERLFGARATPSLFTTLGARPALGRLPTPDDDDRVVVISHWLWTTWFAGDSTIVGRSYVFANATRTVIGVLAPEFRFPDERVALWIPWVIDPARVTAGGVGGPTVVARMVPGADYAGLVAQLEPLGRRLPERYGGSADYARIMERHRPVVRPLTEELVGRIARPLWILLGAVGIVFLIACANVANLFTVRAESRRRDLAVRRALGAGRGGLVRSQMAEALVLAALGGMGGVLIAWAGVPLLIRAAPDAVASGWSSAPIPGLASAGLDLGALLFTAGASIVAACAFGLVPAIRFSGAGLLATLRQAGRGTVGRGYTRDLLVVAQTALALVLLMGSALLMRSFWRLSQVDPGFDTEGVFSFQIAPDRPELNNYPTYAQFHYSFMERLAALPGVQSVGVVATLPLDEGAGSALITTERIEASGAEPPLVRVTAAGGAYFQTMGIELLSGRLFERSEELTPDQVNSVIVSRSAAQLLWPGEDPLGQRLRPRNQETWVTVVGVVEDVLLDNFRRESPEPMVYLPRVVGSPAYVVRSPRAAELGPEVRSLIREVVPESPMYRVFTMQELAARSMASLSFTMLMVAIAAVLALILGAVGLYGVLSYGVTRRTQEIGVRMALGAEASSVRRMVVVQGGQVALVGVAIGLLASLGLTRYIESLLFGIQRLDLPSFTSVSAVMVAVAVIASYLPARRASRVDPVEALRAE
ncbi:MAG TPA: ABC transporter permease [Gemmatimonadales bacterium]|nr:ABC transporter permease [Gemmatimonadales bacterium]